MTLNVTKEVTALKQMSVPQLRGKYAEVFGETTDTRHKGWLIKRIIWRMQANVEGDLSERARRRAAELANDADLRMTAPRESKRTTVVTADVASPGDGHRELPGTVLRREYKGRTVEVTVLHNGFAFEGQVYKSLSAVAKAITGKHWNGYHFFGLRKNGGAK